MAENPVIYDNGGGPMSDRAVARWWKESDPGRAMVHAAKRIEDSPQERSRRRAALIFARLHSGRPLSSIYDYGSAFRTPYVVDPWGFGWKLPLNVVQAVIEAIASKIAKSIPHTRIITEGGDWSLQRQAKGLTKYLAGLNRANKAPKILRQVFRDAGAFGTGIVSSYEDLKRATVGIDRTLPIELIIDDIEAARGKPQTVYRKTPVYRGVLMDMFGDRNPKVRDIIENAKGYNPSGPDGRTSEMLPTYEGWHLNGSHVIALEEGTLFEEEWEFDWFPHTTLHWRQPDSGVWGLGAAENLLGVQFEINQMLSRFQSNMKLGAKLWVFRKPGSNLNKAQLSNETLQIYDAEEAPTFATPDPMPAQAYQYLWDIYAKAFEIEGVSQLSATGVKPAGLDAAVAIREFNDTQTERFALLGQELEEMCVELDEKQIALSKRMYKRGKAIIVRAPGTRFLESIEFEKVDMEENRYSVDAFPVSSLPSTPAARLQTVKEYYESGLIPDRETALSLLDFPDLEAALSLELAAIEDVKRIIEKLVEDGDYEPPEPYMNLALALRMCQSAYLRARNDGVPEKRRMLLLQFIDEVRETQKDLEADGQPAPAAEPMAQAAPAGPPPVQALQPTPGPPAATTPQALPALPQ